MPVLLVLTLSVSGRCWLAVISFVGIVKGNHVWRQTQQARDLQQYTIFPRLCAKVAAAGAVGVLAFSGVRHRLLNMLRILHLMVDVEYKK